MFGNPLLDNYLAQQLNPMNQIGQQLMGSIVQDKTDERSIRRDEQVKVIRKELKQAKDNGEDASVIEYYETRLKQLTAV